MLELLRIVSWNVENLGRWIEPSRTTAVIPLANHLPRLGDPDILCLQEVKIRATDSFAIARMRELLPGYDCELALCDDPRNVSFRGGRAYGVVTYVRRSLGGIRGLRPAWDREGRVVATVLPACRVAVVNLYAVNGTDKPYIDPDTGAANGDRHAYKRRFQAQLLDFAAKLRSEHDVVLAGDWNVSRAKIDVTPRLRTEEPHRLARAALNDRLAAEGWVDVFRHEHPDTAQYTWRRRTRSGRLDAARVDYFVVGQELIPRVSLLDITDDPILAQLSDHAPIGLCLVPATAGSACPGA